MSGWNRAQYCTLFPRFGKKHADVAKAAEAREFQNGCDVMLGCYRELSGRSSWKTLEGPFPDHPQTGLEEELRGSEAV